MRGPILLRLTVFLLLTSADSDKRITRRIRRERLPGKIISNIRRIFNPKRAGKRSKYLNFLTRQMDITATDRKIIPFKIPVSVISVVKNEEELVKVIFQRDE